MNEGIKIQEKQQDGHSIEYGKLWADVWKHKRLYYIVLPIALVVAAFFGLSVPNYYKCEVMLAPELSRAGTTNSLLSLATTFGIKLGTGTAGGEALFPTMYPDLMDNVDFKTSLFEVPVTIEGDEDEGEHDRTMTYYDYMLNEQHLAWWSYMLKGIGKGIKSFKNWITGKEEKETTGINPFRLSEEQTEIVKRIEKKISCDVDQKTLVITIEVEDQEPLICATMADTVKTRLQNFITEYHTSKARVDLEYNKKLYAETKRRYEKARQKYAEFVDANNDIVQQIFRQKLTDLENELQIQYNAYQQVATQLLAAEAKVQEDTPAFTTLQSATVPVKKTGPGRAKFCVLILFLAFCGTTAYIFNKEGDLKPLLGLSK